MKITIKFEARLKIRKVLMERREVKVKVLLLIAAKVLWEKLSSPSLVLIPIDKYIEQTIGLGFTLRIKGNSQDHPPFLDLAL